MARNKRKRKKHPAHVAHLGRQRGKREYWTGWLDGKEVALGTADATVAAERLHRMAQERQRAEANDSPTTSTSLATLAAKFVEFVQPPRRSPRTAETIEGRVIKFIEWAENAGLTMAGEVTAKSVQGYVDERIASGVSSRTVNRDLTPIAGMFRFGKKEGLLSANPLAGDEYKDLRLREPSPAPNQRTLSPAQIDSFVRRAHEVVHPAYGALFALMAGTGIRLDEAFHLDLGDIDHANKLIRITPKVGWTTKNYRFRAVPASDATIKAARDFVRQRSQVSLERKAVWNQLQRVRKSIGLPPFSPHDLRRAWASAMHHRGASLKAVSVWLGHGSLGVTERYVRVIDTDGHQFLPR